MKDCLPFLLIRWILSITHNFGAAPPRLPYGEDAATVSWGAGKRPSCFAWPHNLPKPISGPRWTHAGRPKVTAPATLCEKLPSRFRAPHTATTSFAANGLSALIILKPQRYNRAATTTSSRRSRGKGKEEGGGRRNSAWLGQHEHLAEMPKRKCPKHASQAQFLPTHSFPLPFRNSMWNVQLAPA